MLSGTDHVAAEGSVAQDYWIMFAFHDGASGPVVVSHDLLVLPVSSEDLEVLLQLGKLVRFLPGEADFVAATRWRNLHTAKHGRPTN